MSTATLPLRLPKPVSRKVRLLRWMVRAYVLLDGIAAIVLVLGVAFWLGLAVDWSFEPSPFLRGVMWMVTAMAVAYAAVRFLLGPLSAKLTNSSLALLLERNFPSLNQSVITTVEAAARRRGESVGNERLMENTSAQAATALHGLPLREIFQFGPLLWKSGLALALLLSIGLFAALQSEAFAFWVQRIRLNSQPWPRQVELSVVGFREIEGQKLVNVARDDDFELEVNASILEGHVAPEQVEIRYRLDDGRRGRDSMTRIGAALPGRDGAQRYRYQFKKVSADLRFDVVGGDDRLRDLQLRVVERPQIVRMLLECEFPSYLGRSPQTIPVSGRVELPEGTSAICRLETNKLLESIQVHDPAKQADLLAQIDSEHEDQVSFPVAVDQEDRVLLVTMLDHDGVGNREPYRVVISSLLDQPPEVSVQLRGIGSAITPQAKLPFEGQVSDEYGLQSAWFEYQVDKSPPDTRDLANQPRGDRELSELGAFDLAVNDPETRKPKVALKPGQQLALSIRARDAYNLGEQQHVGSSQRLLLEIVTNSELRSLLEKKELALRQRFESIHEKMIGTRELLDRIQPDQDKNSDDPSLERLFQRDRLRIAGALQNVVQLSHETLGVADGFEDIMGELVNNRVDSEELTERLQSGIADPLREIGAALMPEMEQHLQELQTTFTEQSSPQVSLESAQAQGDVVLNAMQDVLDRMLELESYNELVELLRGIVAEQQEIQDRTKQERREKLRSLLQD